MSNKHQMKKFYVKVTTVQQYWTNAEPNRYTVKAETALQAEFKISDMYTDIGMSGSVYDISIKEA